MHSDLLQSIAILILLLMQIGSDIQINHLEKKLLLEEQQLRSLSRQLARIMFLRSSKEEFDGIDESPRL